MLRKILLIALVFVTVQVCAQSKGEAAYKLAKEWLDKGDNEKAIKTFYTSRAEYLKEGNYYRYFVATQALSIIYQDTGEGIASEKLITETMKAIPQNSSEQLELHAKLYDNLAYGYLYVLNRPEQALKAYDQSISFYEKAGKGNTKDIAFEIVNRAVTLYGLSRYQASVDDMLKAIAIYEKDPDTQPVELASHYHTLGESYIILEEFDKGMASLENGLMMVSGTDEKEMEAKLLNAIGNIYNSQGIFTKALESYGKSKALNEELFGKDAVNYAKSVINIGNAYKNEGDWETALTSYQEVLGIYHKTPPEDNGLLVDLFLNIGSITDRLGMFEQSQAIAQQALTFVTNFREKNSMEEAYVYTSMATTAFNHSEYDQSLNYNFKAISVLEASQAPVNSYYAEIYEHIGQAYDELNNIDLALKYKKQAVDLYAKVYGPVHSTVGLTTGNIGNTYEVAGQHDKALEYLKQSLGILVKTLPAEHNDVGITLMDIGMIYLNKKDPKSGIEFLGKASKIFERHTKNQNKVKVNNRLGLAYFQLGDISNAEKSYQKAIVANAYNFENQDFNTLPDQPEYMNYSELIISYSAKADLFTKRGDKTSLANGMKHLDAADKILKAKALDLANAKDRLELAELNTYFTESGLLLTDKFYKLTKDPVHLEKAFYFSERSKANELFADIQGSRATSLSRIPKQVLERRALLTNRMSNLQQQVALAHSSQNQSLVAKLKAQEVDLIKEYDAIQSQITELSPRLSSITTKRTLPSWNEIKKNLGSETVLVSYTITDSAKYILIGNSSKLVMKAIPPKTDLDKLIRGYTNQVKYQGPALKQISDQLTDLLWMPVEHAIAELGNVGVNKIVIIPDGSLNYLPFESLGKENYLIEKYTLHYQLSGALLMNANQNITKNKPSFIAMAPVFNDKENSSISKTSQRFMELSRKADTTSRAFSRDGQYISPLPATKVEVEKINKIHTDKGIVTKSFIEEAAQEELIKKGELENFGYIHFATHGFANSEYPELSGLLLAQNPQSVEDGILYTGEILGLKFNADLVTLSACETALGKKIQGEGVRGLTTSFLMAGAKTVVSSLWKVADESTSLLMISFYNELLSGKDKATALRLAKLSLLKDERYNHPYYWAPFVQIGGN